MRDSHNSRGLPILDTPQLRADPLFPVLAVDIEPVRLACGWGADRIRARLASKLSAANCTLRCPCDYRRNVAFCVDIRTNSDHRVGLGATWTVNGHRTSNERSIRNRGRGYRLGSGQPNSYAAPRFLRRDHCPIPIVRNCAIHVRQHGYKRIAHSLQEESHLNMNWSGIDANCADRPAKQAACSRLARGYPFEWDTPSHAPQRVGPYDPATRNPLTPDTSMHIMSRQHNGEWHD